MAAVFMFSPFGMVNPVKISKVLCRSTAFHSYLKTIKFSLLAYLVFLLKQLIMLSTGNVANKHEKLYCMFY